jgi:plastocyanin
MKKLATLFVLALVAASLFACGSDDSTTATSSNEATGASEPPVQSDTTSAAETTSPEGLPLMDDRAFDPHVRYAADPGGRLAYMITEASASPGKVTFEFVNPTDVPHNVAIEAPNGKTVAETDTITQGKTTTEVVLKPDVYVLYCSVAGHRKAGMIGHLTVD